MCGIAGFVHLDRERPASADVLGRMTETLAHRGPDGSGSSVCGNVALGHRRLAIIDLETGNQPVFNENGAVAVVLNGEIYNYIEVREELAGLGHRFQTSSDTEVLVHGYEQWGPELESKLNGMWAFGLWDQRRRRLVLSRDRMGEKPLFHALAGGTLVFGSEPKAILAYGVPREPDLSMLELYLTLGYVPYPLTFLKGVRKLAPGSRLVFENGSVTEERYWDLPATPESEMNRDSHGIYEQFEYLLRDSVRLRMRSDVDFGAFLSGGMDSGTIVSLMAGISRRPVQTFTIGFNHAELDERPLARAVAAKFGTRHHEDVVDYPSFEESISKILHHTDEPFGDSSALPTERVSRYAGRHVKMVLSGDGGDEVLCGYNSYQSEQLARYLAPVPGAAVRAAAGALRAAGSPFGRRAKTITAHAAKILRLSTAPFGTRLLEKTPGGVPLVRSLLDEGAGPQVRVDEFLSDFLQQCPWRDPFYQLMYFNLKSVLPDVMLTKVDRMSMAHSLEVRAPFLDHRLVELMAGAHKDVQVPRFVRKAVLRRTLARELPDNVTKARKRGFVAPVRHWLAEEGAPAMVDGFLKECTLPLRKDVIGRVLDSHRRHEADYGNFLWMVLVLARWMKGGADCAS